MSFTSTSKVDMMSDYAKKWLLSLDRTTLQGIFNNIDGMTDEEKNHASKDIHNKLSIIGNAKMEATFLFRSYATTMENFGEDVKLLFDEVIIKGHPNHNNSCIFDYKCRFVCGDSFEIPFERKLEVSDDRILSVANLYDRVMVDVMHTFIDALIATYAIKMAVPTEVFKILSCLSETFESLIFVSEDGVVVTGRANKSIILQRQEDHTYVRSNKTCNTYKRFELSKMLLGNI